MVQTKAKKSKKKNSTRTPTDSAVKVDDGPPTPPKKKSGAAYRKLRKQIAESAKTTKSANALPKSLIKRLGKPPDDSTQVLVWANCVMSALTYELLTTPGIPLSERVRQVRENIKAIGMIYPRSELEELLKRLLESLSSRKEKSSQTQAIDKGAWKTQVVPLPESTTRTGGS